MTIQINNNQQIKNPDVSAIFKAYPSKVRTKLMFLRNLIMDTAASTEGVGEIEETLKWGEPSYLTSKSKSGSTIRIDWKEAQDNKYAMYFKCTANLVDAFRKKYPKIFRYGGNRSIVFDFDDKIPVKELKKCVTLALTYHRNKKLEDNERWAMVEKLQK